MKSAPLYELRRSSETLCRSSIPNLGYSPDILKDMERHGLHLYCDGKKVKSRPRSSSPGSGKGWNGSTPNISKFGGNVNE
jgi:hypothetical protein